MRVLFDTDAFCKLSISNLLTDAVNILGVDLKECGRLPALLYMLRRGRLRKSLGEESSDNLIPVAESIPIVDQASDKWLDLLTSVHDIDPGEAQLMALAAESGLLIVTGDKRALRSIKNIQQFTEALAGRIVVLEAILIALCDKHGNDYVRQRVQAVSSLDTMIGICFSPVNSDPREGLVSYYRNLTEELNKLVLWNPNSIGGT